MWVDSPVAGTGFGSLTPTRAAVHELPEGFETTPATLRVMRNLVRASVRSPDQIVRQKALAILMPIPQRNWSKEVAAIHAFVRDNIRYTRDPDGLELVQTPEKTLEYMAGDCDDQCVLLASLLTSVAHPVKFCALGFEGGPLFEHVLTETKIGAQWIALETIIPKPMGWRPPGVKRVYELKV